MDKKENIVTPELAAFRQQIDALDDKLIALLIERIGIVGKVGEMKRREDPNQCPLRAGREALMIRRIIEKFEGTPFSPGAAAAIWRLLIGVSTAVEGTLKLSVYSTEQDRDLYWLGREYFGSFIPANRQPLIKRVIGDVMDGTASVGIVPQFKSADTTHWWTNLLGSDAPKIFAHVPFVHYGMPKLNDPAGLAIARINPEPTGDDVSIIVLEADHNVSQNRLQTACTTAKLEASWINIATLTPERRHHLIELKGFITEKSPEMKSLLTALGESISRASYLGAYAVPVTLKSGTTPDQGVIAHAPRAAK
jgi:chorismate mutase / prephenate dehydratase